MVWSSGVTPAAVIRTRTLPSAKLDRGTSTSFRLAYPVNDSARMALIMTSPSFVTRLLHRRSASRRLSGQQLLCGQKSVRGAWPIDRMRRVHAFEGFHGPTPANRVGAIRVMYPGLLREGAGGNSASGPR